MQALEKIRQNLEIYPDIEFHLFSSQLDYYTPNAIAAQTAAEIGPRVQFHRLKDSTHDAFAVEPTLKRNLANLLNRTPHPQKVRRTSNGVPLRQLLRPGVADADL